MHRAKNIGGSSSGILNTFADITLAHADGTPAAAKEGTFTQLATRDPKWHEHFSWRRVASDLIVTVRIMDAQHLSVGKFYEKCLGSVTFGIADLARCQNSCVCTHLPMVPAR